MSSAAILVDPGNMPKLGGPTGVQLDGSSGGVVRSFQILNPSSEAVAFGNPVSPPDPSGARGLAGNNIRLVSDSRRPRRCAGWYHMVSVLGGHHLALGSCSRELAFSL